MCHHLPRIICVFGLPRVKININPADCANKMNLLAKLKFSGPLRLFFWDGLINLRKFYFFIYFSCFQIWQISHKLNFIFFTLFLLFSMYLNKLYYLSYYVYKQAFQPLPFRCRALIEEILLKNINDNFHNFLIKILIRSWEMNFWKF